AFVIDQETDVPAGSAVLQQASAVEPGPGGNVAARAITRWGDDRYADVQVVNAEAATGGALEERQAVSADDVAALQQTAATLTGSEALRFALVEDQPGVGVIVRTAVVEAEPGAPTPAIDAPG